MSVDYNNIAKTFSQSRKNMKWEEIEYFLNTLKPLPNPPLSGEGTRPLNILDVWCGNGRFYWALQDSWLEIKKYLWLDLSSWLLEEAKNIYSGVDFLEKNMLNILELDNWWDHIFFIASFHHLENIKDRLSVMQQAYNILKPGWTIYLTNWALDSEFNVKKYSKAIIPNTQNEYWSQDYSIKIGDYMRYYHWFNLTELEYLFSEVWLEILENREFDTGKNIISIIKKPLK